SVVSGQWSVVSGQWSVVSGQWSVVIAPPLPHSPLPLAPFFLLTFVRAGLAHTSHYQQNILQNPSLLTFDFSSP
ncbi:hypothetical protein LAY57_29570, partial [Argonema antarcticum A004/B2]|nr:hypothetical protein [Argonema antarcticum A004/B2]